MKTLGIRQAKAHLSQLVRAAAAGERSIVTDNKIPVAMIGPPPDDPRDAQAPTTPTEDRAAFSGSSAFRRALFSAPYPINLDF